MEDQQRSNRNSDTDLALEIGRVFLEAHRTAAIAVADHDGHPASTQDEEAKAVLAAEVDRIERALVDGQERIIRFLDELAGGEESPAWPVGASSAPPPEVREPTVAVDPAAESRTAESLPPPSPADLVDGPVDELVDLDLIFRPAEASGRPASVDPSPVNEVADELDYLPPHSGPAEDLDFLPPPSGPIEDLDLEPEAHKPQVHEPDADHGPARREQPEPVTLPHESPPAHRVWLVNAAATAIVIVVLVVALLLVNTL